MSERVTTRQRAEQRRLELLQCVIDSVEHALARRGIEAGAAHEAGVAAADMLVDQFGGQVVIFPMDVRHKMQQRDAAILARFTGDNAPELARELHMSERGMRKLLQRARARQKAVATANVYDPHTLSAR